MVRKISFLVILFIVLSSTSFAFFTQEDFLKNDSQLPKPTYTDEDVIQKELSSLLTTNTGPLKVFDVKLLYSDFIREIFQKNNYNPIWISHKSSRSRLVRDLIRLIQESADNGLDSFSYHNEEIEAVLGNVNDFTDFARLEILLTDALIGLVKDIAVGRVKPENFFKDWYLKSQPQDIKTLTYKLLEQGSLYKNVSSLYPQTESYKKLKEALVHYEKLVAKGPLPVLPNISKKMEPGDHGPHVAALRKRLAFTDDLSRESAKRNELYDEALKADVMRFQRLNGLNDDGVVGIYTYKLLNEPLSNRVQQIKANLERMRLYPESIEADNYILINVPDSKLFYVENGKTKLSMRTVVGIKKWQTPIFSDEMEYVVINPQWNVPPKILEKETLPMIQKDPEYIKKENFLVYRKEKGKMTQVNPETIDWATAKPEDYHLSQRSGRGNALGRIKFMFPNPYSVYLHDTPSKSLFKQDLRAFSHGCIRVEKPLDLAEQVFSQLHDGKIWTQDLIKEEIASEKEMTIVLPKKIPVYIRYMTAWVDDEGNVNFRADVYDFDKKLAKQLSY